MAVHVVYTLLMSLLKFVYFFGRHSCGEDSMCLNIFESKRVDLPGYKIHRLYKYSYDLNRIALG